MGYAREKNEFIKIYYQVKFSNISRHTRDNLSDVYTKADKI